jgi:hypothetical protein
VDDGIYSTNKVMRQMWIEMSSSLLNLDHGTMSAANPRYRREYDPTPEDVPINTDLRWTSHYGYGEAKVGSGLKSPPKPPDDLQKLGFHQKWYELVHTYLH